MLCDTCKNKGCCGLYSDVEDLKAELISCKKYIYSPVEEVKVKTPEYAVEVVRCSNCVDLKADVDGAYCDRTKARVRFDDYCSYGERRR